MNGGGAAPNRRWSLRGVTEEGDEAWLIRSIAGKLYRCPGCHGDIPIGTEHHHWHRQCAEELLIPDLRELRRVPASESEQSKLEARGRRPSGRRR